MDFKSELECIEWVRNHTAWAIKPTKKAKTMLVAPFISNHAFDVVTQRLGEEFWKLQNESVLPVKC